MCFFVADKSCPPWKKYIPYTSVPSLQKNRQKPSSKLIWHQNHQNPIGKNKSSSQPFWEVLGFLLGEIAIRLIPRFFGIQGFTLRSRFQAIAEGEASNRAVFAGVLLGFFSGRSSQACAVWVWDVSWMYLAISRYTSSYPPVIDDFPVDYSWISNFFWGMVILPKKLA